jgi:hypothetical protein
LTDIFTQITDTQGALNPIDTEGSGFILKRKQEDIFLEENSTRIISRDVSTDTIWGVFIWGASNWDNAYANPETVVRVVNPNNIYREYMRDDDFINLTNTTATVATASTFNIVFADTEIYESTSLHLNNNTITSATLNINSDNITNSSNLTFELSADGGSNYEAVTLNTSNSFTTTGQDLRLKITCSGTAQIDIDDAYGISIPIELKYIIRG